MWRDKGEKRHPDPAGSTVRYAVGKGLYEQYDVRADGLEQSLVLNHRPGGAGPLVMRTRLVTDLAIPAGEYPRGFDLREETGLGRIHVGEAVAIDATGRRTDMGMRVEGGDLVVTVDARTLDSARYPLVLDPVLGRGATGNWVYQLREVDIAYDETERIFGCVAQRSGDELAFFFRMNEDGDLVDLGYPIDFCLSYSPGVSVANINEGDWFLTAVSRRPNGDVPRQLSSGARRPRGRHPRHPRSPGNWMTDFELGGEMLPPYDAALLAITTSALGGSFGGTSGLWTQRVAVEESGQIRLVDDDPVMQDRSGVSPLERVHSLAVTKTGGVPGYWGLTWQEDPGRSVIAIVNWKNESVIGLLTADSQGDPACAGDGSRFLFTRPVYGCPGQGGELFGAYYARLVGGAGSLDLTGETFSWQFPFDIEHIHPSAAVAGPGFAVGFALADYLQCKVSRGGAADVVLVQELQSGGISETQDTNIFGSRSRTALASATSVSAPAGSRQRALLLAWDTRPGGPADMHTAVLEYRR